jgi:glycosyltransferase involved in cell wall biosynthesis
VLSQLCAAADRIVTVSEAARADIISSMDLKDNFVINCGQGVPGDPPNESVEPPLGLPAGGYFLFCGAVEPRKNLLRLIEAHRRSKVPQPLVIAGPDGWHAGPINAAIARTPAVSRVGYLDRGALLALIRHARGLLLPSLAEGFGLPVIEAMGLGTPVLTSSFGALAEVAGDAAILVNPLDVEAIAGGIRLLSVADSKIAELTRRGRARARHFSPTRFAKRLAAVYDEAATAYSSVERLRVPAPS